MKPYCLYLSKLALLCLIQHICVAQDSAALYAAQVSPGYFDKISGQSADLSQKINSKSQRVLQKLQKQEAKLQRKFARVDSLSAKALFADADQKYQRLYNELSNKTSTAVSRLSGDYLPYFDSLKGSLSFFKGNGKLLSAVKSEKVDKAWDEVQQMQNKFAQADAIKQFINERRQQIQDALNRFTSLPPGISKAFGKYKSEAFYFATQIRDYKETFRDPDKMQRLALAVLNKIPAFQQFMKEHSELGNLFSVPGNYGSSQAIVGLQTRDQVQQALSNQLGGSANISQVLSQQVQGAQSQLDQFKQKLNALGSGSGDIEMPDFKTNPNRTKTFLQRLEYGTTMQSTKSNYFWPMTSDIGLMVGYKIGKGNSVGAGASYKIGWGKDIKHIAVTSQGVGLRSFLDIKIKNSFFASGGFEYNYQKPFKKAQELYHIDEWQRSGLLGITKIVSLNNPVFKKTKLSLLWDFLSYSQRPRTEPIKFRVGYNF